MEEPTVSTAAVSPPSPPSSSHNLARNPSPDAGSSSPASPDDYMKPQHVLQQVGGLELPSAEQQQGGKNNLPPPQRKKYSTSSSDASTGSSTDPPTIYASTGKGSNSSSLNNTPNSHHSTTTPTELLASTSNKTNNTNKQNVSSASGNRSKKFQFYVPTATGDVGPQQQQLGGSNRSGGGSSISDLDIIAEDIAQQGQGGGGGQKRIKGIDPPEIEPPTSNTMHTNKNLSVGISASEESAYKARSRLIQLQHRGGHNQGNSAGGGGKKHKQRQQQKSSSQSHSQRGGNNRTIAGGSDEDDDDYPLVTNIDPVESDDDNDNANEQQQQQQQIRRYSSPQEGKRSNTIDASYMNNYPSSAPQRPSHKLPPQQLMQYLHAGGRGSFNGRQGQQQGGQQQQQQPPPPHHHGSGQPGIQQQGPGGGNNSVNIIPNMPLSNSSSQQQQQLHNNSMQYLPQRHQQPHIQQQQQQQISQRKQQHSHKLHRSLQPTQNNPQYKNLAAGGGGSQQQKQPRRQSEDPYLIYSDGIDLLEKAAGSSNVTRDEVDTLNDGITYLRNLEKEMTTTGTAAHAQQHGGDIAPSSAQQIMIEQQEQMQAYAPNNHSPRKKKAVPPPPPPPPNHSYNKVQLVPTKRSQQHRPPPKNKSDASPVSSSGNRSRSISLGDEMEKMAMAINNNNNNSQQQQQQQQKYRPPPPRNKPPPDHHPASPTNIRKRPVITAASALDYVMSASPMDYHHNNIDNDAADNKADDIDDLKTSQESPRAQEVSSYIDAIMNDEGATDAITNITKSEELLNVLADELVDDSSSDSLDYDTDHDEEFERQSSLSMHAEDKFLNPSGISSSRYAEDKQGLNISIDRLERLTVNSSPRRNSMHASDPSFHLRKGKKTGSTSNLHDVTQRRCSMDPPENEIGSNNNSVSNDHEMSIEDNEHSESLSPSVLPMRTMNERLYAVEAVIPTPTRYDDEYVEDVDSFDQAMPRMDGSAPTSSHALGPRSQRPGGITGVVLDVSDKQRRQDTRPDNDHMERERRLSGSPLESSSSQSSSTTSTSDEDNDNTPQSALGDDHNPLDTMSFGNRQAANLMMKLCSHLLPVGLINDFDTRTDSSLSSLLIQNKSMLEWDDEDPDEPGYVVHRLTNSQLVSVENAFEKMVSAIERSSVTHVRNGSNNDNFERDLEEAEMILDQEEKRYESEVIKKKSSIGSSSTKASDSSKNKADNGMELQLKQRPDNEIHQHHTRDSVPDFPGIYPPGKGKAGEMECFYLPIITKSEKTGFEPTKDLVLNPGSVFANNYLVQSELGSAAFSTAYRCLDLSSEEDEDGYQDEVCLKVIKNTKDYFDQSLDEIKILQLLKDTGRVQENNIVEMKSFFYHREHLVIVTELLRQNLYEFGKSILESRGPLYFTRLRLSHITRQCLVALKFVHDLGLMHCDIKPENILLSSYSRALVKVIDFGSSSFVTDRQSSYIQSRSYRAPEVILGLPYDGKIDIWSLGCVVAEMYTNEVTFQNDSELSMLSRIEAICGPFPRHMIANGSNSHRIFTDSGLIYEKISSDEVDDEERLSHCSSDDDTDKSLYNVYQPKMTTVAARLGFEEDFMDQPKLSEDDKKRALFVDFVSKLLTVDPDSRPSAAEALNHPWITSSLALSEDDIKYGPERI